MEDGEASAATRPDDSDKRQGAAAEPKAAGDKSRTPLYQQNALVLELLRQRAF